MKKTILGFVLFIVVIAIYSFWTDFALVKRLVGYNVSKIEGPPIAKPKINTNEDGLGFLTVPEGFKISVGAADLDSPRVIAFDPRNRMLVSETKAGRVRI